MSRTTTLPLISIRFGNFVFCFLSQFPDGPNFLANANLFDYFWIANTFCPENAGLASPIEVLIESIFLRKKFWLKIVSHLCAKFLKFRASKKNLKKMSSQFWNSISSVTQFFILSSGCQEIDLHQEKTRHATQSFSPLHPILMVPKLQVL